jgi:hypothetical protein
VNIYLSEIAFCNNWSKHCAVAQAVLIYPFATQKVAYIRILKSAMPTLPPRFSKGDINALTTLVAVEGQTPGAQVFVLVDGATVLTVTASETYEIYQLPSPPPAGSHMSLKQQLPGDPAPSDASTPAIQVRKAPTILSTPRLPSEIYDCAEIVWASGDSGAQLTLADTGRPLGGPASVPSDLFVFFPLVPKLTSPILTETAPTAPSVSVPGNVVSPPHVGSKIQPPIIADIHECSSMVRITNLLRGALVTLTIDKVAFGTFATWVETLNIILGFPLRAGQSVTCSQALPKCQLSSDPSIAVAVRAGMPTPKLSGNCFDPASRIAPILISNIVPGTGLIFNFTYQDHRKDITVEFSGATIPYNATDPYPMDFPVPPLPPLLGEVTLSAQQGFSAGGCSSFSGFSKEIRLIEGYSRGMPAHDIGLPFTLYADAVTVHCQGYRYPPGTDVRIISTTRGTLGYSIPDPPNAAGHDAFDIDLTRRLADVDLVFARAMLCGGVAAESQPLKPVIPLPETVPPPYPLSYFIGPPMTITVDEIMPGFDVELKVDGGSLIIGAGRSGTSATTITIYSGLEPKSGDHILARHVIAGRPGPWSTRYLRI